MTQVADSNVLVVDWPDPGDLLTGRRAAREVMEVTGRRPVAFTPDFGGPLYFRPLGPSEPADWEAASAELDPWPALHAWDETADNVMETVTLEDVLNVLGAYRGEPEWSEPTLARELLPQIESPTAWNTLQYDLLELIVGRPDRLALMPGRDRPLRVCVPNRVQLALLPTTGPWLTALWALYSYQPKPKVLAACLRQWHQTGGCPYGVRQAARAGRCS